MSLKLMICYNCTDGFDGNRCETCELSLQSKTQKPCGNCMTLIDLDEDYCEMCWQEFDELIYVAQENLWRYEREQIRLKIRRERESKS